MLNKSLENSGQDKKRLELASRIKDVLSIRGMKTRVAEACNVSNQAVSGWISKGRIDKEHLLKIAEMTSINLDWLITGKGEKYQIIENKKQATAKQIKPIELDKNARHNELISLFDSIPKSEQDKFLLLLKEKKLYFEQIYQEMTENKQK